MTGRDYQPGDMVWSAVVLCNDGSLPEIEPRAVIAEAGARGVVVKAGSLEKEPEVRVYLVRFEGADGALGAPVGCFKEELTQQEPTGGAHDKAAPSP